MPHRLSCDNRNYRNRGCYRVVALVAQMRRPSTGRVVGVHPYHPLGGGMRKRLIAALTGRGGTWLSAECRARRERSTTSTSRRRRRWARARRSKPLPVKLGFGYDRRRARSGLRPTVIEQYQIAPEGLDHLREAVPRRASSRRRDRVSPACNKAKVGRAGRRSSATDPSGTRRAVRPHAEARLQPEADALQHLGRRQERRHGDPARRRPAGRSPPADRTSGCTLAVHTAIKAPVLPGQARTA